MLARKKVEKIIGKGFADHLEEGVINLGYKFFYTRREMVEKLGCANFIAASKLNAVLKRLKIETPAQLFKLDPYSLARVKGVGASTLFVALCILDANKFSVEEWWGWHDNENKFSSFKANAIRRAKRREHEA